VNPLAWRGIGEMARFLIRTRPEAQPAIPLTGRSFSTQGFAGQASMGSQEWVNIYNFSSRSFKQYFQAVRPSSFISSFSCISQSRRLLSSRNAFVNHCYTTPQPGGNGSPIAPGSIITRRYSIRQSVVFRASQRFLNHPTKIAPSTVDATFFSPRTQTLGA
jgi:hypothetical protein